MNGNIKYFDDEDDDDDDDDDDDGGKKCHLLWMMRKFMKSIMKYRK